MTTPVIAVNELVLEVADLPAAERFYTDILGFPVLDRWTPPRDAVWVLAGIGLWLPQTGIARAQGGKRVHYALLVAEQDYAPIVRDIRGRNAHVDEVHWNSGARSAYIADPDFNVVEFWTQDVTKGNGGGARAASAGTFALEGLPVIPR